MAEKKKRINTNIDDGSDVSNAVGKNLKNLRKAKHLSQQDLADKVGIKRSTYSSYETGNQEMKVSDIFRLCQFYKISPNVLLYDPELDQFPYEPITISVKGLTMKAITFLLDVRDYLLEQ